MPKVVTITGRKPHTPTGPTSRVSANDWPVMDANIHGHQFFRGCTLPSKDCSCRSHTAARLCRFLTDSPFILELERQLDTPNRKKHAYTRAFAALHEAGHAFIAYQYIPHASICIPFNDPMSAYARHTLELCEPRAGAAASYAGAVINKMLIGTAEHAAHDLVAGREKLVAAFGHAKAKDMQHEILVEVTRELHTNWRSVEAIATAAMKTERLHSQDFERTARLAGMQTGVRRQRQPSQAEVHHLSRFSKSPRDLLLKLNSRVINIWKNWLLHENARGRC